MEEELRKCLSGEWYNCHNSIFIRYKQTIRQLLQKYNSLGYNQKSEKKTVLKEMFEYVGENVSIGSPFICDYGCNISIGNNVSINTNCVFLDCNKIKIEDNVLIGPSVQLYTVSHPVELTDRLTPNWKSDSEEFFCRTYSLPIKIGAGSWIGGGTIILPGITIGEGAVIGAGSVVTKDIPSNCVAVGNPCRIIRNINY